MPESCPKNAILVKAHCRRVAKRMAKRRPGPGKCWTKAQLKDRARFLAEQIAKLESDRKKAHAAFLEALDAGDHQAAESLERQDEEHERAGIILRRNLEFTGELLQTFEKLPLGRCIVAQDLDQAIQRKLRAALSEAREEARDRYAAYLDQRALADEILADLKRQGVDLREVDAFERFDSPAHRRKLAPPKRSERFSSVGGRKVRVAGPGARPDLGDFVPELVREYGLDAGLADFDAAAGRGPADLLAVFLSPALENKRQLEDFVEAPDPQTMQEIEALEREARRVLRLEDHDSEEEDGGEAPPQATSEEEAKPRARRARRPGGRAGPRR